MEATLMMVPDPCFSISAPKALASRNGATRFTSSTRRKSSTAMRSAGAIKLIPALLTSTSQRPQRWRTASPRRSTTCSWDVAGEFESLAARLRDASGGFRGRTQVAQRDGKPFSGKYFSCPAANSLCRSGDHRHLYVVAHAASSGSLALTLLGPPPLDPAARDSPLLTLEICIPLAYTSPENPVLSLPAAVPSEGKERHSGPFHTGGRHGRNADSGPHTLPADRLGNRHRHIPGIADLAERPREPRR